MLLYPAQGAGGKVVQIRRIIIRYRRAAGAVRGEIDRSGRGIVVVAAAYDVGGGFHTRRFALRGYVCGAPRPRVHPAGDASRGLRDVEHAVGIFHSGHGNARADQRPYSAHIAAGREPHFGHALFVVEIQNAEGGFLAEIGRIHDEALVAAPGAVERSRRAMYASMVKCFDSTEEIANYFLSFRVDDCDLLDYVDIIANISWDDVMNVLLIGSDERGSVDTARSDAMIVLSVNENTKKIVMTSILRDSYVNIPGYGMQRINHSYQMGGPALLIQTIEENFKIGIDYYASVDFFAFMDIIDCVDGVEITVTDEEVQWVNAYVADLNSILGDPEGDGYISGAGTLTMTGKQALAYSRIRYVGTDFARTERQRTVLNAVIDKLKSANPIQLFRVVNTVLPDVDTDMDDHAMTMTLFKAITYLGYDIEQFRVPMDGTWWNEDAGGQEVLGMDFAANIAGLQNTIYGE